eukprot:86110_1
MSNFIVMGFMNFIMDTTVVSDSQFHEAFIYIEQTIGTFNWDSNEVSITNCKFNNVNTQIALIHDGWISCNVHMENLEFIDINQGSLYIGWYHFVSSVNLTNIFISTSQIGLYTTGLFDFLYADTVWIDNLQVNYYYDVNKYCHLQREFTANNILNASYAEVFCDNPINLITNPGAEMTMNNINVSINITELDIKAFHNTLYNTYDYVTMEFIYTPGRVDALITNYGELELTNFYLYGLPFCETVVQNYGVMIVDNFHIIFDKYYSYFDPNALQSRRVIQQARVSANMTVRNSKLLGGGGPIIYIQNGYAYIYDTIFDGGSVPLYANSGKNMIMSGCTFIRTGRYWAKIVETVDEYLLSQMIWFQNIEYKVLLENNQFEGFDNMYYGTGFFVYSLNNAHFILRNNSFVVNATDLFYDVPNMINNSYIDGLVIIVDNRQVTIYDNNFYQNDVNPTIPWIKLDTNSDTCLSANNFSNMALTAINTNITSCFRKSLIDCVNKECKNGEYGNMNVKFYNKMSYFNIDINANITSFFNTISDNGYYPFIAIDNIEINIYENYENR